MRHFTPSAYFSGLWGVMRLQAAFWEKESMPPPPPQRKRKGLVPQPGILGKWLQVCPESEVPCVRCSQSGCLPFQETPQAGFVLQLEDQELRSGPKPRVKTVPALQEPA